MYEKHFSFNKPVVFSETVLTAAKADQESTGKLETSSLHYTVNGEE